MRSVRYALSRYTRESLAPAINIYKWAHKAFFFNPYNIMKRLCERMWANVARMCVCVTVDAIAIIRPANDNRQWHNDIALNSFQFSTKMSDGTKNGSEQYIVLGCHWIYSLLHLNFSLMLHSSSHRPILRFSAAARFVCHLPFTICLAVSNFPKSCHCRGLHMRRKLQTFCSFCFSCFFFRANAFQLLSTPRAQNGSHSHYCTHCLRMTNDNAIIAPDTDTYALEWTRIGNFRFFFSAQTGLVEINSIESKKN